MVFARVTFPLTLLAWLKSVFPKVPDLYLNDVELSVLTLVGMPSSAIGDSSFLNYHKRPDVPE